MKNKKEYGTGTECRKIRTFQMDGLKMYCRDALGSKNERKHRNQREILVYLLKVNPFPPDF